jgi:hypothetical protein
MPPDQGLSFRNGFTAGASPGVALADYAAVSAELSSRLLGLEVSQVSRAV